MRHCGNTTFAFFLIAPDHEYLVRDRTAGLYNLRDNNELRDTGTGCNARIFAV